MDKAIQLREKLGFPKIGFGTFGNDKYDSKTVADSVYTAIKCGYKLFDCASVYGNEELIGEVFAKAFKDGLCKREELFITSKVWNDMHGKNQVIESCEKTLKDLKLDYVDLYFVHWPFPNYHARGCTVESRNKDSKPFFTEDFMGVWEQMEALQKRGLVKHVGMSNMTIPKFEAVLPLCNIKPFAHEMEMHVSFQQKELFEYCVNKGTMPLGNCPLGSPNRPERDKAVDDVIDVEIEAVKFLAQKHSCHPIEICLKWAVQNGQIPIPFSSKERNILSNLHAVENDLLSEEEMRLIGSADANCRFVKGHVFLWRGSKDWTDLWDLDNKLEQWVFTNDVWKKI